MNLAVKWYEDVPSYVRGAEGDELWKVLPTQNYRPGAFPKEVATAVNQHVGRQGYASKLQGRLLLPFLWSQDGDYVYVGDAKPGEYGFGAGYSDSFGRGDGFGCLETGCCTFVSCTAFRSVVHPKRTLITLGQIRRAIDSDKLRQRAYEHLRDNWEVQVDARSQNVLEGADMGEFATRGRLRRDLVRHLGWVADPSVPNRFRRSTTASEALPFMEVVRYGLSGNRDRSPEGEVHWSTAAWLFRMQAMELNRFYEALELERTGAREAVLQTQYDELIVPRVPRVEYGSVHSVHPPCCGALCKEADSPESVCWYAHSERYMLSYFVLLGLPLMGSMLKTVVLDPWNDPRTWSTDTNSTPAEKMDRVLKRGTIASVLCGQLTGAINASFDSAGAINAATSTALIGMFLNSTVGFLADVGMATDAGLRAFQTEDFGTAWGRMMSSLDLCNGGMYPRYLMSSFMDIFINLTLFTKGYNLLRRNVVLFNRVPCLANFMISTFLGVATFYAYTAAFRTLYAYASEDDVVRTKHIPSYLMFTMTMMAGIVFMGVDTQDYGMPLTVQAQFVNHPVIKFACVSGVLMCMFTMVSWGYADVGLRREAVLKETVCMEAVLHPEDPAVERAGQTVSCDGGRYSTVMVDGVPARVEWRDKHPPAGSFRVESVEGGTVTLEGGWAFENPRRNTGVYRRVPQELCSGCPPGHVRTGGTCRDEEGQACCAYGAEACEAKRKCDVVPAPTIVAQNFKNIFVDDALRPNEWIGVGVMLFQIVCAISVTFGTSQAVGVVGKRVLPCFFAAFMSVLFVAPMALRPEFGFDKASSRRLGNAGMGAMYVGGIVVAYCCAVFARPSEDKPGEWGLLDLQKRSSG